MRIEFDVQGTPAWFTWDNMTGKAELGIADQVTLLQDPMNPATHISFGLEHKWHHSHDGSAIEIVKTRPLFFAGFRPNAFVVRVNGGVVAESRGL